MRFFNLNGSLLRPLVVSVLTVVFVGCQPPKQDNKPAQASPFTKVSNLSETAASCETKIRNMMTAKTLRFQNVDQISGQISMANAFLLQEATTSFAFVQANENTKSLTLEISKATQDAKQALKYDLSLNDSTSKDAMNINIGYELNSADSTAELDQSFQINEKCELRISQTTFKTLKKKDSAHFTKSESNYYVGNESDSKTSDFSIPEGGKLYEFSFDDYDINTIDKAYSYVGELGLLQVNLKETTKSQKEKFGLDLDFKVYKLSIGNESLNIDIEIGQNEENEIQYSISNNSTTWTVPEVIWNQQALGTNRDLNQSVQVRLPEKYFNSNPSIQISVTKMTSYEHFDAYWSKSNIKAESDGKTSMTLTEKSPATIVGTSSALDLVSNDTIQTELPAIQKVAKSILAIEPLNRKLQVQLILKYLSENYVYDYVMLENNVVRPLTTEEALIRGKGVCQHYAVIFTALARAMKIPTRIIVGFHLSETSAGGHAWNEVEISKGTWQVIEPQASSIEGTHTRFYLPLARALFLEDKNASTSNWIMEYLNADYKITAPSLLQ